MATTPTAEQVTESHLIADMETIRTTALRNSRRSAALLANAAHALTEDKPKVAEEMIYRAMDKMLETIEFLKSKDPSN